MTRDEAYELWAVCMDQVRIARDRLDTAATAAVANIRADLFPDYALEWAFDAQDVLECAEAALSTAREAWNETS